MAPNLSSLNPEKSYSTKKRVDRCIVREPVGNYWTLDICGGLTVAALSEFLDMRDLFIEVHLEPDIHEHRTIGGSSPNLRIKQLSRSALS